MEVLDGRTWSMASVKKRVVGIYRTSADLTICHCLARDWSGGAVNVLQLIVPVCYREINCHIVVRDP